MKTELNFIEVINMWFGLFDKRTPEQKEKDRFYAWWAGSTAEGLPRIQLLWVSLRHGRRSLWRIEEDGFDSRDW